MVLATTRDIEGDGEWSDVQDLVIIPIHSIVLPDGKVFSFGTDEYGIEGGQFIYSLYDPETGQNRILENTTDTNLFCSNMAIDPATGNVIIMGGDQYRVSGGIYSGVADVNVFDYQTQTIRPSETGDMAYARWYGSVATLDDGEILILAGRDGEYRGSTIPEIYNAETGFRELPGAEIADIDDNSGRLYATFWYPHLWQASDGRIFMVEAEGEDLVNEDVFLVDVEGDGAATKIDTLPFDTRNTSPSVMFDVDQVLIVADDGWVWQGDLSQEVPSWEKAFFIPDENEPGTGSARTNGNFVLMPNGRVALIGGGGSDTILGNQLKDAQYSVFVWDPETGGTETWADTNLARLYHSTGLILPDGTLWSGGGGAPGPLQNDNIEIFTPPYLFDADGNLAERPEILDAPRNVTAGQTFRLTVDDASDIETITAIRSGAQTHARNADARLLKLDFEAVDATTIEVSTPGATIFGPGLWMIYAVDAAGVPSEAALTGVNMAPIVDTPPIEAPTTVFYDINDDAIEGAFLLSVDARFDDVAGGDGQTVFAFTDGETGHSISLAQVGGGTDIAFTIVQGGTTYTARAEDAIVEGQSAIWRVGVGLDGVMRLAKGDTVLATLDAGLEPGQMARGNLRVGGEGEAALAGVVRNLHLANADDFAALDPDSKGSPSAGQGSAQAMTAALVSPIEDLPGNQAPVVVAGTSATLGAVTELPDFADGEDESTLYTGGVLNLTDPDGMDGAEASVSPRGGDYAGQLQIVGDIETGPTGQTGHLQWRYSVRDGDIASLAGGESLVQVYDVTVTDTDGASVTQSISVTLNGADDAPGSSDLNVFFGAIDEPIFKLLSGFVNGLVKVSAEGSEAGVTGVDALAAGYLDLVGLDDPRLAPGAEVNPALKPYSDGVDRYLETLSDGGNGFADWIGLMTGEGLNATAAFGDRISDATGQPTPFIDAFEFYLLQLGGGAAYAVGEITGSITGFIGGVADAFFGVASAHLDAAGDDPLGVFSLGGGRPDFDGVRGVTGLDGLDMLTGGDGDDEIVFAGHVDRAEGAAGADLLTFYDGAGSIDLGGAADRSANGLALNGGNVGEIAGSGGADTLGITVGSRVERAQLGDGADHVFSAGRIETLETGAGADMVTAREVGTAHLGNGDDLFLGGAVGMVHGGDGRDEIAIATGTAHGGGGRDTFHFIPGSDGVRYEGGAGWDTLILDLDEAGISRRDLLDDLGVWDLWGDITLWGRDVESDLLGLELSDIETIDLV